MIRRFRPHARHLLALLPLAILAGVTLSAFSFDLPSGHDAQTHMFVAVKIVAMLEAADSPLSALAEMRPMFYPRWPVLQYAVGATAWGLWRDVRAFHLTSVIFAAACMLLVYFAAWRSTGDRLLALAAVLTMSAGKVWLETATSYNLEMPLVAGTAGIYLALWSRPMDGTPLRALAIGAAASLCLLTKTVVLIFAGAPVAVVAALVFAIDPRRRVPAVAFLAGLFALPAWWYWPHVASLIPALGVETYAHAREPMPWWFYLETLATRHAAGPLAVATILAFVFRAGRPRLVTWLPPLAGAVVMIAFLTSLGTKRDAYFLAPYLLLVLTAYAPIASAREPVRRALTWSLVGLYGAIGVLSWFPEAGPLVRVLALGTTSAPNPEHELLRAERPAVDAIRAAVRPEEIPGAVIVCASEPSPDTLGQLLILDDPAWTLPGLFGLNAMAMHGNRFNADKIRGARVLIVFQDAGAAGLSGDSLVDTGLIESGVGGDRRDAVLRRAVEDVAASFRERARAPVAPGRFVVIYERIAQ